MGVLTDLVIADPSEAEQVGKSNCPSRDFGGVDAKGIDPVKLATLNAILANEPHYPEFAGDPLLYEGSEEGPWVMQVPTELVRRLAAFESEQLESVAAEWGRTEEFAPEYRDWSAEEVRQVLESLANLSRRAVAEGKGVLMWMSL